MRIVFLSCHKYQNALLRPLYDRLDAQHDCLLCETLSDTVAFLPDIVVQGEGSGTINDLRTRLPRAQIVHVRHGLACKNVAYEAAALSDYALTTSPWMREWFRRRGATPRRAFWTTGYPPLDPLFHACRNEPLTPMPLSLEPGRSVVLYAPTYNQGLSSIPLLHHGLEQCLRALSGIELLVKPHPHTRSIFPQWLKDVRQSAQHEPHLHFIDPDDDIIPYLQHTDALITDVSSISLAFLALDRPVIQLTSPGVREDSYFDPGSIEWQWRDMGDELFDIEALPRAVEQALINPGRHQDKRRHYRRLLFGDLDDGNSTERLCQRIDAVRPGTQGAWY